MKRLTAKAFFADNRPFGRLASEQPIVSMPSKDLFLLMQAYADHCEEFAWVDASERLPERYEGYPLTKNCLLFDGEKYLFGFYSYAHSQWESDKFAPLEHIAHWRPLPTPPQKIPANAPQEAPQEEKI